jgi:PiT family inorganic phosphate transporter
MNSAATATSPSLAAPGRPDLNRRVAPAYGIIFLLLVALGALFAAYSLVSDTADAVSEATTWLPFLLLGVALTIALGFEFVNGFHDTANAVATVIYTHSLPPPPAYALNRALPVDQARQFIAMAQVTQAALVQAAPQAAPADPRATLSEYVRTRTVTPDVVPALAAITGTIGEQVREHGSLRKMPSATVANVRNDMYLASEAIRFIEKSNGARFDAETKADLKAFKKMIDAATKFIPLWVKVAVAIALGLGTMVGWKRIVVTVGEKIGKSHLTYAQGACAELVAMATIGAVDAFGLPVSTTHVLSSGVAGTMAANRSGLQLATIRNLVTAWVLTLPAAIVLSGSIYWLFTRIF